MPNTKEQFHTLTFVEGVNPEGITIENPGNYTGQTLREMLEAEIKDPELRANLDIADSAIEMAGENYGEERIDLGTKVDKILDELSKEDIEIARATRHKGGLKREERCWS